MNFLEDACELVAGKFGEPDSVTRNVLNLRGADLSLYTFFRPAWMKDGEKYPVITWGNGTCGQTGGYGSLLATLASYGSVVRRRPQRVRCARSPAGAAFLESVARALYEAGDVRSVYTQAVELGKTLVERPLHGQDTTLTT